MKTLEAPSAATEWTGAAAAVSANILPPARYSYRVRIAEPGDVPYMQDVERDTFPAMWPPTHFGREVRRSNGLYLVASRPWQPGEREAAHGQAADEDGAATRGGFIGRLARAAQTLTSATLGSKPLKPPDQPLVGLIGVWFAADEAHIVTIATRTRERRRGAGKLLLQAAIDAAIKRGVAEITLEVRRSNFAAQELYQKYGFHVMGVRKRYYVDNREDALIMTTPQIQDQTYRQMLAALRRDHATRAQVRKLALS